MNYAILRTQKVRSLQDLGTRAAHNLRTSMDAAPHADPLKRHLNELLVGPSTACEVTDMAKKRYATLTKKIRKNAVYAIEVVLATSPGFYDPQSEGYEDLSAKWVAENFQWLNDQYGEENIISLVRHVDESTSHLQALVVPIHEGALRASHWLDGRTKLRAMQTNYASAMAPLGLRRGEVGSTASHVVLQEYYRMTKGVVNARPIVDLAQLVPELPAFDQLSQISPTSWAEIKDALASQQVYVSTLQEELRFSRPITASVVGQEAARRHAADLRRRKEEEERFAAVETARRDAEAKLAEVESRVQQLLEKERDMGAALEALEEKLERQRESEAKAHGKLGQLAEEGRRRLSELKAINDAYRNEERRLTDTTKRRLVEEERVAEAIQESESMSAEHTHLHAAIEQLFENADDRLRRVGLDDLETLSESVTRELENRNRHRERGN